MRTRGTFSRHCRAPSRSGCGKGRRFGFGCVSWRDCLPLASKQGSLRAAAGLTSVTSSDKVLVANGGQLLDGSGETVRTCCIHRVVNFDGAVYVRPSFKEGCYERGASDVQRVGRYGDASCEERKQALGVVWSLQVDDGVGGDGIGAPLVDVAHTLAALSERRVAVRTWEGGVRSMVEQDAYDAGETTLRSNEQWRCPTADGAVHTRPNLQAGQGECEVATVACEGKRRPTVFA